MIGLNASLAFHFGDGHLAFFGKQLRQMALVLGIEVLNQHECHAGIVRQMAEQLRECLQSAGGGAYADNGGATGFNALHRRLAVLLPLRKRENVDRPLTGLLCHTPPLPFSDEPKHQHVQRHS